MASGLPEKSQRVRRHPAQQTHAQGPAVCFKDSGMNAIELEPCLQIAHLIKCMKTNRFVEKIYMCPCGKVSQSTKGGMWRVCDGSYY